MRRITPEEHLDAFLATVTASDIERLISKAQFALRVRFPTAEAKKPRKRKDTAPKVYLGAPAERDVVGDE